MDRPTAVEQTAGVLVPVVLLGALAVGIIWPVHILAVVAAYAVVLAAAVRLARNDRTPGRFVIAGLSAFVLLVVWLPVGVWTGLPPGPSSYGRLYVARLAGQWAIPIALMVPLGLVRSMELRLKLVGVHVAALLALIWAGAIVLGNPLSPTLGATSLLFQHYVLGVLAGYPAALLLYYRERLEVVFR